jgi:hypothetical protein
MDGTEAQSESDLWHQLRALRITGSTFKVREMLDACQTICSNQLLLQTQIHSSSSEALLLPGQLL